MKNIVFVQDKTGAFHQHGPVRKSEAQAENVARQLSSKLGWFAVAAASCPPAGPLGPAKFPPPAELAGLSPIWKHAGLAKQWAARKPVVR